MPVKDPDYGLVWSNYNPSFYGYFPNDQSATKPFYFAGSQVPQYFGIAGNTPSGTHPRRSTKVVKGRKKF